MQKLQISGYFSPLLEIGYRNDSHLLSFLGEILNSLIFKNLVMERIMMVISIYLIYQIIFAVSFFFNLTEAIILLGRHRN